MLLKPCEYRLVRTKLRNVFYLKSIWLQAGLVFLRFKKTNTSREGVSQTSQILDIDPSVISSTLSKQRLFPSNCRGQRFRRTLPNLLALFAERCQFVRTFKVFSKTPVPQLCNATNIFSFYPPGASRLRMWNFLTATSYFFSCSAAVHWTGGHTSTVPISGFPVVYKKIPSFPGLIVGFPPDRLVDEILT